MNHIEFTFTEAPDVPDATQGKQQFNINATAWLKYWKDTIKVEFDSLIAKLNNFIDGTNDAVYEISTAQQYIENTLGTVFDVGGWNDTDDFQGKTTTYKGAYWTSTTEDENINSEPSYDNTDWVFNGTYFKIVNASDDLTALNGNYVKVDLETIGKDITITLEEAPIDLANIVIANMVQSDYRITVQVGGSSHTLLGENETGLIGLQCETKLIFDDTNKNWYKG